MDTALCEENIKAASHLEKVSDTNTMTSKKAKECGFFTPCGPDCPCGMNRNWLDRTANTWIVISFIISVLCFF